VPSKRARRRFVSARDDRYRIEREIEAPRKGAFLTKL
jgi:hypothetical protein